MKSRYWALDDISERDTEPGMPILTRSGATIEYDFGDDDDWMMGGCLTTLAMLFGLVLLLSSVAFIGMVVLH